MEEPGLDRHEWETEWQALEPLVEDSPEEALPELDALIERMLREEGYPLGGDPIDDEGIDPDVLTSFEAAHEIAGRAEATEPVDPGDVGYAIGLFREIYEHLRARQQDVA
jgi:hypothetical protein